MRFDRLLSPDMPSEGERRSGSVQLRANEGGERPSPIDPANQSIADALKVTFVLLKVAMLALCALYVLSGFQFVKEGEQGIRLLFGKVENGKVDPGFRFSWPFPLGELVRVDTGARSLAIDDVFWVDVPAGTDRNTPVDKLNAQPSLKPSDRSGSLLTADGNIAHARVSATYRRSLPGDYSRNVYPGPDAQRSEEQRLVRLAIQRGVVHAVSGVSIDDLLKQSNGEGAVSSKARASAQALLDSMSAGIAIDSLTLEPIAPLSVRTEFANVQAAVSKAAKAVEEARLESQKSLNAVAGAAAPVVIAAIGEYEAAIAAKNKAGQDASLAKIDAIFDTAKVDVEGKEVQLTGEAARMMSEARQYRGELVARRRAELEYFKAKLEQFRSSPDLMVQREWASAVHEFYQKDFVEIFQMFPNLGTVQLSLNRDQDISKAQERLIKQRENAATEKARMDDFNKAKFKTNVDQSAER